MILKVKQLIEAISGATLQGNRELLEKEVDTALTDSRSLLSPTDTVFFALKTDTGDGHNYIEQLYTEGVRVFVAMPDRVSHVHDDALWIFTEDPLGALQSVGKLIRTMHSVPVIGVTGSKGKTVLKEMLNMLLTPLIPTAVSPRSWNSQLGLPLSMWEFDKVFKTELGVFEAGISHTGEMSRLYEILRPSIGIFTELTDEHERGFSSLEEKCREKCVLFGDSEIVYALHDDRFKKVFSTLYPDKQLEICEDYHDICRRVARHLGVSDEYLEQAINKLPVLSSRIDYSETADSTQVALDRLTCDLPSIRTALDDLRRRVSSDVAKVVVIGDLICPKEYEKEYYFELEKVLSDYGVSSVMSVGAKSGRFVREFATPRDRHISADIEELRHYLSDKPVYDKAIYINGQPKSAFFELYSWLSSHRNVTQLEINLDSIAANLRHYRSLVPYETGLIGMVKASAYGCGAVEVSRTLQDAGADMIAVAVVDEGVELRRAGVSVPIMVLDPWCENMRAIFAYNLHPTLIDADSNILDQLEKAADSQGVEQIMVHVKLDTGMHRVGLSEDEIPAFVELLKKHPRIRVATVFSHLATADCEDLNDYTEGQLSLFHKMSTALTDGLGYGVKRHILNTAGVTRYGRKHVYELARIGIGLYGISPLGEDDCANLRPVARLRSRVIAVRHYPAGTCVGYGCNGHLDKPSIIGTVPIGYADGIDRRLGNGRCSFMVNGHACPTVGNICMDLCMIDLTDCPDAYNAEVEIFGPDASIERIAEILGTIPYEVLARVSPRVKRVYFRE